MLDDVSLWQGVLALGDDQPQLAVERADALSQVALGMARGFHVDPDTVAALGELRRSALQLDLARWYGMLPQPVAGGREIRVAGRSRAGLGYTLSLGKADPPGLGSLDGVVTMRPAAGGAPSYAVDQSLRVGTGAIRPDEIVHAGEAVLQALSASELGRRVPSSPDDPLLDVVQGSFPRVWTLIGDWFVIDTGRTARFGDTLWIDTAVSIDADRVRRDGYPALAAYLDGLGALIAARIDVDVAAGTLLRVDFEGETPRLRVRMATREGGWVPFGADGALVPGALVRLSDVQALDLHLHPTLTFRYEGVIVEVSHPDVRVRYTAGPARWGFRGVIDTPPDLALTGAPGNLIGWVVDAADDALGLSEAGRTLMSAVAHGPDGDGTRFGLGAVADPCGVEQWLSTALVDNGIIRLGARMVASTLVPSDPALTEGAALSSRGLLALDADYQAVRPALLR
jgi:hypothetical protein